MKTTTRTYELIIHPIEGVSKTRAEQIAQEAGLKKRFFDDGEYEQARDQSQKISDLGGIRRVDILSTKMTVQKHIVGAHSMGRYMRDRHVVEDYHWDREREKVAAKPEPSSSVAKARRRRVKRGAKKIAKRMRRKK